MHHTTPEMQQCIEDCQKCHATCLQMALNHCLEMGGRHTEPSHFRRMMDCAQICQTAADFTLRGSAHHVHVYAECVDICESCAQSCERIGDMEECVSACRKCAESCRQMIAA